MFINVWNDINDNGFNKNAFIYTCKKVINFDATFHIYMNNNRYLITCNGRKWRGVFLFNMSLNILLSVVKPHIVALEN